MCDQSYDNYIKERIYEEAKLIMNSIKDGRLYGKPIDVFNTAELIVAAYYVGFSTNLNNKSNPFEE